MAACGYGTVICGVECDRDSSLLGSVVASACNGAPAVPGELLAADGNAITQDGVSAALAVTTDWGAGLRRRNPRQHKLHARDELAGQRQSQRRSHLLSSGRDLHPDRHRNHRQGGELQRGHRARQRGVVRVLWNGHRSAIARLAVDHGGLDEHGVELHKLELVERQEQLQLQ